MTPRTLILALHFQRAAFVARQRGLSRPEWRFADRMEDVRGVRGGDVRVIVAASFYERDTRKAAEGRAMLQHLVASGVEYEFVSGH